MKNELILKKCVRCGALVQVLKDCTCDSCKIQCCENEMLEIPINEFSINDKHFPKMSIVEDELFVELEHPMDKEHFIEYIYMVKDNIIYCNKLFPEGTSAIRLKYLKDSVIYIYCNIHGLFKVSTI